MHHRLLGLADMAEYFIRGSFRHENDNPASPGSPGSSLPLDRSNLRGDRLVKDHQIGGRNIETFLPYRRCDKVL